MQTALDLFHRSSFKGTSLNQIVAAAETTKGALFHHFKGKNELGYAIVDELLGAMMDAYWVIPLANSTDPVTDILGILAQMGKECHGDPEHFASGCPMNNLSQEMSSSDETFRLRLGAIYDRWEGAIAKAIASGIKAGNVRTDVDPIAFASILVALFEGAIGMIKVKQSPEHYGNMEKGIRSLLESIRN